MSDQLGGGRPHTRHISGAKVSGSVFQPAKETTVTESERPQFLFTAALKAQRRRVGKDLTPLLDGQPLSLLDAISPSLITHLLQLTVTQRTRYLVFFYRFSHL